MQLYSAGRALDMNNGALGLLRESSQLVTDGHALAERLSQEGYVFLPQCLDRYDIIQAREVITTRLAEAGFLDLDHAAFDAVVRDPHVAVDVDPEFATVENPGLEKAMHGRPLMSIFERIFGGPARFFEYSWFRSRGPGRGTRPHCDIVYMGRGTSNLLTAWIPLGDVTLQDGGLMVLEGSHQHPLLAKYYKRDVDEYCLNGQSAALIESGELAWEWDGALTDNPVELRNFLGGRWLTATYRPGDVVIFSAFTAHASLDNTGSHIRLSVDCRYQPATDPIDERWISKSPVARGRSAKRGRIC